jgi:hypothetical protein
VDTIVAGDIRDILQALADAGSTKQTCQHVRNDISALLGEFWRLDMLPENVCKKVRIPKSAKADRRERGVLTNPRSRSPESNGLFPRGRSRDRTYDFVRVKDALYR